MRRAGRRAVELQELDRVDEPATVDEQVGAVVVVEVVAAEVSRVLRDEDVRDTEREPCDRDEDQRHQPPPIAHHASYGSRLSTRRSPGRTGEWWCERFADSSWWRCARHHPYDSVRRDVWGW